MLKRSLVTALAVAGLAACSGDAPRAPASARIAKASADDGRAACTAEIGALLKTLREPLVVTAYVTPVLPKLRSVGELLDQSFARYQRAAPGRVVYRRVDPTNLALEAEAKEAGLQQTVFGEAGDEDTATVARGYSGVAFRYADEKESIPVLASPLVLHRERQPDASLRFVARTTPNAIAFDVPPPDLAPNARVPSGAGSVYRIAAVVEGKLRSAFGAGASAAPSQCSSSLRRSFS